MGRVLPVGSRPVPRGRAGGGPVGRAVGDRDGHEQAAHRSAGDPGRPPPPAGPRPADGDPRPPVGRAPHAGRRPGRGRAAGAVRLRRGDRRAPTGGAARRGARPPAGPVDRRGRPPRRTGLPGGRRALPPPPRAAAEDPGLGRAEVAEPRPAAPRGPLRRRLPDRAGARRPARAGRRGPRPPDDRRALRRRGPRRARHGPRPVGRGRRHVVACGLPLRGDGRRRPRVGPVRAAWVATRSALRPGRPRPPSP